MVLCKNCKWFLRNALNNLFVCWATDEDISKTKAEDDVPCGIYEPLDSDIPRDGDL